MFSIIPPFNLDFWFAAHPASLLPGSARTLVAFFAILLIVGAVVRMVSRRRTDDRYVVETFVRMSRLLTTMGFLGLVWLFFAVEEITFLQARYWMLAWILGAITWAVFIWRYVKKTIPAERERHESFIERNKYLPEGNRR